MKAEEEACIVEDEIQEENKHKNAQLKVEKGFHLALEARWRAEEED